MNRLSLLILFPVLIFNCTGKIPPAPVIDYNPVISARCDSDSLNSYHLSLPADHDRLLPLVVLIDPHGNGELAVNNTLPALQNFPCIVAGSDAVHNNMTGYSQLIHSLILDIQTNYKVSRVFVAGFSGGARMAFTYAEQYKADGVLMCGAGPDMNQDRSLPCPVFMIAGTADFNFAETYYNPLKTSSRPQLMSAYFNGIHEWPPADIMRGGMLFLAGKFLENGKALMQRESINLTEKADSLQKRDEMFLSVKALELSIRLDPENRKAKKMREAIRHDRHLSGAINRLEEDLAAELKINQGYIIASMDRDSAWWFRQLEQLSDDMESHRGDQKAHYMRMKSFLGILFYSRLNTMIREEPDNARIVHLLAAYRKAEPQNPDVYYDYALYFFRHGNGQLSIRYLKTALAKGFTDTSKLMDDFPGIKL